jgi:hypothetical protein
MFTDLTTGMGREELAGFSGGLGSSLIVSKNESCSNTHIGHEIKASVWNSLCVKRTLETRQERGA